MNRILFAASLAVAVLAAEAAPPSPPAKPEDARAGQCWSATKSGNRCKRRAAPKERYCRQHAADSAPAKTPDRCRSFTEGGTRCNAKPVPGRNYCEKHMKPGA